MPRSWRRPTGSSQIIRPDRDLPYQSIREMSSVAAIFFATLLTTQIAFERHRWVPVVNLLLACVGLFVAYHLFSHVRVRFDMWLDPWKDFNNKGYQIIQALFAIAEGGFFGTGIGLGHPDSIPLGHSDFIFASVVEEMGACHRYACFYREHQSLLFRSHWSR